jgi:hypothetical protein
MAASGRVDSAVSCAVSSVKIGSSVWKIGDPIYSTGITAVKKSKMVESFGNAWQTARAEGV